ncbi:VOC family protein [Hymenobacter psychrophilus]|uniref:Lactoylglutathione lyase n=1 Tax=Hymenobacter psychrophilus TaxID=651662 RepID=A0A1H3L251_9BACT|nr:VOC family protein [Hymenobacter psychrophilus]SDY58028.1 lactoylglutathione lyase [Hymenobacter psychrophilus]
MQTPRNLPPKNPGGINGKMNIGHVGLRVPDYAAAIGWYTQKLGFRVLKEWTVGELQLAFLAPANDDTVWLEVLSDGTLSGAPTAPPLVLGYHHICLEVENVDQTLADLRERGVATIREPFDVPAIGKRCGFVADLNGNVLEFSANC